jgi:hypothetical protein
MHFWPRVKRRVRRPTWSDIILQRSAKILVLQIASMVRTGPFFGDVRNLTNWRTCDRLTWQRAPIRLRRAYQRRSRHVDLESASSMRFAIPRRGAAAPSRLPYRRHDPARTASAPILQHLLPCMDLAGMQTEPARQFGYRAFLPDSSQRHFRLRPCFLRVFAMSHLRQSTGRRRDLLATFLSNFPGPPQPCRVY